MSVFISAMAQDTWVQKASFGGGERYATFHFSIGVKGYVGTGADNANTPYADFWEFDPATNVWTQKANFGPGVRMYGIGFSVGDKGYAGTGVVASYNWRQDMWAYDPAINSWTQVSDFAGGLRGTLIAFSIGNKAYVGSGEYRSSPWVSSTYCNDFYEYSPATDSWVRKADIPTQGRAHGPVAVAIGNKGYVGLGCYYYDNRLNDWWEYDPSLDNWNQKASIPTVGRVQSMALSIGNKAYVGLGTGEGNRMLNDLWEYNPLTDSWTQKNNPPGDGRTVSASFTIGNRGYLGLGSYYTTYSDFWEYAPEATPPVPHPFVQFDPLLVTTIAGNGEAGFQDGLSSTSQFNYPNAVAADEAGNVYVADRLNHCIRKITPDGFVSTFAGSTVAGFADGMGTSAQFNNPWDIAFDKQGNLYVADASNNCIRKITADAMVSTISRNAVPIPIDHPQSITVDAAGNIFVAEYDNNLIKKYGTDGSITLFAGSGIAGTADGRGAAASFFEINDLAFDAAGNLFVTELYGPLRKITVSADVTTIWMSDHRFNTFQNGLAIDSCGRIYISILLGGSTNGIFKTSENGVGELVSGMQRGYQDGMTDMALFNFPGGLAFDKSGNLFVADVFNQRIRKYSAPRLLLTTEAGSTSQGVLFTVSAKDLSAEATVVAPDGCEISFDQSYGFEPALVIPATDGFIKDARLFIRLKGTIGAGNYNGDIRLTADGAISKLLRVSGVVTDVMPPNVQCVPAQVLCFDASNHYSIPPVVASDISGIKSYSFIVQGATHFSGNLPDASGTYNPGTSMITWKVTDNAGNITTCSTSVRINAPMSLSIPNTWPLPIFGKINTIYKGFGPANALLLAVANGGTRMPTTGYKYAWSNGATTPFINVSPNAAGMYEYSVTVTDSLGCIITASKTIEVIDVRCGPKNNEVLVCWSGKHQNCYSQTQAFIALLLGAKPGPCNSGAAASAGRINHSIQEVPTSLNPEVNVYPNPNNGTFTVQLNEFIPTEIRVADQNGRIVLRQAVNTMNKSQSLTIHLGLVANGIYTVQAINRTTVITSKIIVQR